MRAVVDDRELAALNGVRPGRVSSLAWALGSSLAAIAGILLAPSVGPTRRRPDPLHRRRVRGRDHRPAAQPPVDVLRRADHRRHAEHRAQFPAVRRTMGNGDDRDPRGRSSSSRCSALPGGATRSRPDGPQAPRPEGAGSGSLGIGDGGSGARGRAARAVRRPRHHRPPPAHARVDHRGDHVVTGATHRAGRARSRWPRSRSSASARSRWPRSRATRESWLGAGNPLGLVVAAAAAVPFGVLMALPALRLQGLYLALASMAFAVMAIPLFFEQPEILGTGGTSGDTAVLRNRLRRRAQLPGARGGDVRAAGPLRGVVASWAVRPTPDRLARQSRGERDHRCEPGVDETARVRAGGRDGRLRRRSPRDVPWDHRQHRLRDARRHSVPAAARGRRRGDGERRAHRRA